MNPKDSITSRAVFKEGRSFVAMPWHESLKGQIEGGHEVKLLETGADFFPALLAEIEVARESIFLETYLFQDDDTGKSIAHALVQATLRGVAVHLVIDGFGAADGFIGEVKQALLDSSVRLEIFRPQRPWFDFNRQRLRRLHRKLCVVDGRTALVGGINVLDDFNHLSKGKLEFPRLDFAVLVRGPLVAHAHVAASRLWWEIALINRSLGRKRLLPDETMAVSDALRADVRPPQLSEKLAALRDSFKLPDVVSSDVTAAGDTRAMLLLRDNFRNRRVIENWYLKAIGHAHREIIIANAYFFPGVKFRRALIEAVKRGVRVQLLLQGKVEFRLQDWASHALYDELLRGGVEIVEYTKSFLHAKVAVIDDQATVGSSNIDPFSLLLAREANVVVQGGVFASELRASLLTAMQVGGVAVEPKHHMERPWLVRLAHRFGYVLLRFGVALSGVAARF